MRTEIVPALGCLITGCDIKNVHDKAYMLLQTFLTDLNHERNHPLTKQLIITMGNIVNSCTEKFRYEGCWNSQLF